MTRRELDHLVASDNDPDRLRRRASRLSRARRRRAKALARLLRAHARMELLMSTAAVSDTRVDASEPTFIDPGLRDVEGTTVH